MQNVATGEVALVSLEQQLKTQTQVEGGLINRLIFIDATWRKAYKMIQLNL